MASPNEDANAATRESPSWIGDFFGAVTGLGSAYITSKYGHNDQQYVKGADGNMYPAGVPSYNVPTSIAGMSTGTMLLLGGALLIVVVLVVAD